MKEKWTSVVCGKMVKREEVVVVVVMRQGGGESQTW